MVIFKSAIVSQSHSLILWEYNVKTFSQMQVSFLPRTSERNAAVVVQVRCAQDGGRDLLFLLGQLVGGRLPGGERDVPL
jgi:hypothetical protein